MAFPATSDLRTAALIVAALLAGCLLNLTAAICQWQVSVTSQSSPFVQTTLVQDRKPDASLDKFSQNVRVHNMERKEYRSFPYFLYLQVSCDGAVSHRVARTLASSGTVPVVTITQDGRQQYLAGRQSSDVQYTLRGALVNADGNSEGPTVSMAELHRPAWLVPLVFDGRARVLPVHVETEGSGYEVKPTRQFVSIDGYHEDVSDEDGPDSTNVLGAQLPTTQALIDALVAGRPYTVTSVPGRSPTLAMAGIPSPLAALISSKEFSTYEAVQISFPEVPEDDACPGSLEESGILKQALALPDSLLLLSNGGALYEARGLYAGASSEGEGREPVRSAVAGHSSTRCYRGLSVSPQSGAPEIRVLAVGESATRHSVFAACLQSGVSLDFQELTDDRERGVCDILSPSNDVCSIVSATASAQWDGSSLVLFRTSKTYHIAAHISDTSSSTWYLLSNFSTNQSPQTGDDATLSSEEPEEDASPLLLSGMTFSGLISSHLFLWGRRLLHSPDGGTSVYGLSQYTSDANITLFTVSQGAEFAFLNEQEEVWYGLMGQAVVLSRLRPSAGYSLHVPGPGLEGASNDEERAEEMTLSLFFDMNSRLQEFVATANGTSGLHVLRKRAIPVGDILQHQDYVDVQLQGSGVTDSAQTTLSPCPVGSIAFEVDDLWLYAGRARFEFGAPYVSTVVRLHGQGSLWAYQAAVHSAVERIQLARLEVDMDEELKRFDPLHSWHEQAQPLMAYHDYVFQNRLPTNSNIAISPLEYFKSKNGDGVTIIRAALPEEIFLDHQESFFFAVYLTADYNRLTELSSALDLLMLSMEVSDQKLLEVTTTRETIHLNTSVKYQVALRDQGSLMGQSPTGVDLQPVSVLIHVWGTAFNCFGPSEGSGGSQLKGTSSLSVSLGCPPGRRLVFDVRATLIHAEALYGKIYDCPVPDANYPCFYYKQGFTPVFRVLDMATGDSSLFTGRYVMTVIGGSVQDPDNPDLFDEAEMAQYNQQNGSGPLIWKPKDAGSHGNGTSPVFSHGDAEIVWRCEQGSPCGSVPMNFPWPPEYYFVLEVTNRGVEEPSTYCEHTTRFTIKVHGLELSKHSLLAIVGWSLLVSAVMVVLFVLCHRHKVSAGQRRPKKRKSKIAPMPTITESQTSEESDTEEVINIVEGHGLNNIPMGILNAGSLLRVPGASGSSSSQHVPSSTPAALRHTASQL